MKNDKDAKPDQMRPAPAGRTRKHKSQPSAGGDSPASGGSRQGNIGHQDNDRSDNSHR